MKIEIWSGRHSLTEPAHVRDVDLNEPVPRKGDLVRYPGCAAARVDDVVFNFNRDVVEVLVR